MKNYSVISGSLFLALFTFLSLDSRAQQNAGFESVTVLGNKDILHVCGFIKETVDTLDMASIRVAYELVYKPAPEISSREGDWVLLNGKKFTRWYCPAYERADSITAELAKKYGKIIFRSEIPLEPAGEVYRDLTENMFHVIQRFPFQKDYVISYTEPDTSVQWTMCPKIDTIGGYRCNIAKAEYGGRTWTAWYTPEIPINAGPWKLCGLPGLILQASDASGSYDLKLLKIERTTEPIVRNTLPSREQSKEKWLRSECGFHMSPSFYFSNGGTNLFFEKGSSVELGKSWNIIYNPIEWPKMNE